MQALFGRFRAIYGNRATVMWGNEDPEKVHAVWGTELAPYEGRDIMTAMAATRVKCPEFPPTLWEFVALVKDAARTRTAVAAKLEAPEIPPDPQKLAAVKRMAAELASNGLGEKGDCRNWARKIRDRVQGGYRVPMVAVDASKAALAQVGEAW